MTAPARRGRTRRAPRRPELDAPEPARPELVPRTRRRQVTKRIPAELQHALPCLYEITIGEATYIGATRNYRSRMLTHLRQLERGTHHNPGLQAAFTRHGRAMWTTRILHVAPLAELGMLETRLLESRPDTVNIERVSSLSGVYLKTYQVDGLATGTRRARKPRMVPRVMQRDARTAVLRALNDGESRCMVVAPCGSGKTKFAAYLAQDFRRTLFVTHRDTLLRGTVKDFMTVWPGHHVGVVKQREYCIDHRFTVASLPTLVRRLANIPPHHYDLIVMDEAHLCGSPSAVEVMAHFTPQMWVGVTATAERSTGTPLNEQFGRIVYEMTPRDGIEHGILVPPRVVTIDLKLREAKTAITGDDYDGQDVTRIMNTPSVNAAIVEHTRSLAAGRPTLVYVSTMRHARALAAAFGPDARAATSDDKNAHDTIAAFKAGDFNTLVSVDMVSYGFDAPRVSAVVMATMTQSRVRYAQIAGRGMRTAPCKTDMLLLDFGGNHARGLRIQQDWDFGAEELALATRREVIGAITTPVDDDPFADVVVDNAVVTDVDAYASPPPRPTWRVGPGPATAAQLAYLRDLGYDPAPTLSARAAYHLLGAHPASAVQEDALAALGFDVTTYRWSATHADHVLALSRPAESRFRDTVERLRRSLR